MFESISSWLGYNKVQAPQPLYPVLAQQNEKPSSVFSSIFGGLFGSKSEPTIEDLVQKISFQSLNFKQYAPRVLSALSRSEAVTKLRALTEEREELSTLRKKTGEFLSQLPTDDEVKAGGSYKLYFFSSTSKQKKEAIAQIQNILRSSNKTVQQARQEVLDGANDLIAKIDIKIADLNIKERAAQDTLRISQETTKKTLKELSAFPKINRPAKLDRGVCVHTGGNVLKREGEFIYAYVQGEFDARIAELLTKENLVHFSKKLARPKQGTIENGRAMIADRGTVTFSEAVRLKVENGRLQEDRNGPIIVYKLPVKEAIDVIDKTGFGSRQRTQFCLDQGGKYYVARLIKEHKNQADHKRWTETRELTAATTRAEALLIMEELMKLQVLGKADTLDFNDYTAMISHLGALHSNDVGALPDSFRSDVTYANMRKIFVDHFSTQIRDRVLGRNVHNLALQLVGKKEKIDKDQRLLQMQEVRDTFKKYKEDSEKLITIIEQNYFSRSVLSWFNNQLYLIQGKAGEITTKLNHLLSKPDAIDQKTAEFWRDLIKQISDFNAISTEFRVAFGSEIIKDKLEKYLSKMGCLRSTLHSIFSCLGSKETMKKIYDDLSVIGPKTFQDPPRWKIFATDSFKSTPFNATLIDSLDAFKGQQKSGYLGEDARIQRMNTLAERGYHSVKKYFFPNS